MDVRDFWYDLPQELIAQDPLEDRASSRLLVLDKVSGDISHKHFFDIIDYLNEGDCLVLNETKVIPARLMGVKKDTGAAIEILLLKRKSKTAWECLVKPGKKCKIGAKIDFGEGLLSGTITDIVEEGNRIIEFEFEGIFEEILDKLGTMPLPPYIKERLTDKERYQTVYSKEVGSSAAPTAGLHFTKELLEKIKEKGVNIAYLTLHVGLGTFRPVAVENIEEHDMHSEYYTLDEDTAKIINKTKENGGRVFSVGTTSTRTLETIARDNNGKIVAASGWTNIFIYPGFEFKCVDGLITNFHLPKSSLIMLVSAFYDREKVIELYNIAVENKYRFFSFGDAMIII